MTHSIGATGRPWRFFVVGAVLLAASAVACDAVLGLDSLHPANGDGGTSGSSGTSATATSSGTSSSASGGSSSSLTSSASNLSSNASSSLTSSASSIGSSTSSTSSVASTSSSSAACQNAATQCVFNGVQTCTSGTWGTATACPSDTPSCSNGACGQPPSCQASVNGTTNCGAGGSGNESCCASPEVPAGTYNRTYTNSGSGPTGEADPASISGFRLDTYLVTVGRFRQFVSAWNGGSGWTPSQGAGKHTHLNAGQGLVNSATELSDGAATSYETGWNTSDNSNIAPTNANLACNSSYQTWTNAAGSQENLPINCENWYEAYAFCIWDGGFLPSEAEWEYAAAGGSEQLEYPWGSAAPGTACPGTGCEYAIYDCDYPS